MSDAVAVIGAGAWGTALAIQAARAGGRVTLWARDPAGAAAIAAGRANAARLPGVGLPGAVAVTADAAVALDGATLVLLAVPMQHQRAVLAALPGFAAPVLACAKGMEAGTLLLPLEMLAALRPRVAAAVLSGPNFAAGVAAGLPAAAVVAAVDPAVATAAAARLATSGFRLYRGTDPVGVQVCGAAKNVVALAAGAVIGAGLGENARAALVTRGLAEIGRLVVALGGQAETVAGLAGLGDLLLTATGGASRNYTAGLAIGRGEAPATGGGVTEGIATAPALVARAAAAGVELPVCAAVAALLAGTLTLAEATARLLARPSRGE